MKKVLMIIAILICLAASLSVIQAQDQRTLERVDQAMTHLTQYLGLDQAIGQTSTPWSWQEEIYEDASFACPYPNQNYPATPNRAFRILITVEGIQYDYRISGDGSLLVLCGADNLPIYRSDAPEVEDVSSQNLGRVSLIPELWQVWLYSEASDTLYLNNPKGLLLSVQRPKVPNESTNIPPKMAISLDSRYLAQTVQLEDNSFALSVYDFSSGNTNIMNFGVGEMVRLGFGLSPSAVTGTPYIFNNDSSQLALGVDDPSGQGWRVLIYNLANGTIAAELNWQNFAQNLTGRNADLDLALSNLGNYVAQPVYFANDGRIHIQLLPRMGGYTESYAAFAWDPASNTSSPSPLTGIEYDIQPLNGMVALSYESDQNGNPANSLGTSNTIAGGKITGTDYTLERYVFEYGRNLGLARWADVGRQLLYFDYTAASWVLYNPALAEESVLDPQNVEAQGVYGGAVTLNVNNAVTALLYYPNALNPQVIWTMPPQYGNPVILWAQPSNVAFALDTIALNPSVAVANEAGVIAQAVGTPIYSPANPPAEAIAHCPDTALSVFNVGLKGRVSYLDGSPLNMRDAPARGGKVVKQLEEGTRFGVIGGPSCSDGFTWWQIQLEADSSGWVAEGDQEDYYIEPLR